MKANLFRMFLIGFLVLFPTGCNPVTSERAPEIPTYPSAETTAIPETQTSSAVPAQGDPMETEPVLPIPAIPGLQPVIEKAKGDLSQRAGIPPSQINVIEARQVFWPDASLGCPQPGMTYAQTEVSGYLIILEANGNPFEYHANIHNYVFYCENPTPPVPETPTNGMP